MSTVLSWNLQLAVRDGRLDDFTTLMNEEEKDDPPDLRNPKHWQLFHVVARKR